MSHYKPYPAYKDSGVEWLGQVPEHWNIKPLWSITSLNDDIREAFNSEIHEFEYVDISSVTLENGIDTPATIPVESAPSRAQRKAKVGDIAISTVRTYLRAIGKVLQQHENAVFSTGFAILRVNEKLLPEFLYYTVVGKYFLSYVEAHSAGISYPAINATELVKAKIPVPFIEEQVAIINVLDREAAPIDALVAAKTRFIELLQEKRQALITRAVTKGLDPKVKMKDSGVEWLGQVPEHWEVKKLRHVARIVRGASPRPAGDPLFFAEDNESTINVPWVTVAEITKDNEMFLRDTANYLTPAGTERSQSFLVGTVVFSNSGATLGVPKILAINCCANDGVLAFNDLLEHVDSKFLYYFLTTTTTRLRDKMKNGAQPNLNTDIVKDIVFPMADINEQIALLGLLIFKL